jgi:murein DD-endopeptidase MepM/ murein hydrolase activator NlpD
MTAIKKIPVLPRAIARRVAFALALAILAHAPGAAEGRNDQGSAPWSITAPGSGFPGDCVVVDFSSTTPLSNGSVALRNKDGTIVARAQAFAATLPAPQVAPDAQATAITQSAACVDRLIALVALPSTLKPGDYALEAFALSGTEAITARTALAVKAKAFTEERIELNDANTGIKTDLGPERLAQIAAFNRLISTIDPASPRYSGPFKPPVASKRMTAGYGDRRTYHYSNGRSELAVHYGTDYGVPTGTPVFAAGDGLVVLAESRISTGWSVIIEHLPGVYSLYYHLDALTCSAGESVRAGTLIGRSGMTGLATGPHLHLEWRVNGEAVSPAWFLGKKIY